LPEARILFLNALSDRRIFGDKMAGLQFRRKQNSHSHSHSVGLKYNILGMDFLKESGAIVDLECNKMSLTHIGKVPRAKGMTLNTGTAITFLWR